ncbi:hypothetical protein TNIN_304611 [Trichonephila inaurata madagascariensis]|uniref:Uncharacterized protein n=1 Tax=Trichonephila inaurata madagascariensis TaxID=2747483 RepID=A0A8X7BPC0_9ARAC|nr:hypothetical protein TNIN_304611 [Trichonephila inaurata madagascariensis]
MKDERETEITIRGNINELGFHETLHDEYTQYLDFGKTILARSKNSGRSADHNSIDPFRNATERDDKKSGSSLKNFREMLEIVE